MISIKSYEKQTEEQMKAYMDTLHPAVNKARYVVMFGEGCHHEMSGMPNYIKKHFMEHFEEYKYDNVFCMLNATNKFVTSEKSDRLAKNIFNYDTLMFDIDAKGENLGGYENQFVDELFNFCKMNLFPLPNAFSYTGSGGIHLYYTIVPCYPGLGKAIKSLKYIMADKLKAFIDDYRDSYGMDYVIDTKVFDDMRMDRVPGTMNPKTGRMCEFFTTNAERYTFRNLLNYNDDIDMLDWDRVLRAAKNNYFYGKGKHTKIVFSNYDKSKKRKIINTNPKKNPDYLEKNLKPVLNRRINGFFELAKMGYDFKGARETSCFALRQICRNCRLSEEKEIELLHKLNECFYEPFDEKFLLNHTDSKRQYKFSNESLAEQLGLDVTDEMFVKAFHATPKIVKAYGFNKPTLRRAKIYIAVAGELSKDITTTVKTISRRTGFTIDQVKKAVAVLRHDPEGLAHWNNISLDEYEYIIEYFKIHSYSSNKQNSSNKQKKNVSNTQNTSKELVIYKKDNIIGSVGKKVVITEDILNPTPIGYAVTHKSELLMGRLTMLKKEADSFKDRNPRHKRVSRLLEMCCVAISALYSAGSSSVIVTYLNKQLHIPYYNAFHTVYGYWNYSHEYIQNQSDKYLADGNIQEAPIPAIKPIYDGKIESFPVYHVPDTFRYQPSVIYNHYYNKWSDDDTEHIFNSLPMCYGEYYYKTRDLLKSYRMHRDTYKKAADKWNVEMAN